MISIVISLYNVEKYITKCLDSIINQEYRNFELVLVNDGSTDNCAKVASDYLKDKEVEWKLINKTNGGQGSSRNAGLKECKGDFVLFMDSDDAVANNFLSSLIDAIEPGYDFSFCNFKFVNEQFIDREKEEEKRVFNKEELLDAFLKRTISFVVPSMLFRKDFLVKQRIRHNEKTRFSEDQLFIWDVILHSEKSVYLPQKMYGYFVRENSVMTGSPYQKIMDGYKEYKIDIDRMFSEFPQYENIKTKIMPRWEIGTLFSSANLMNYEEFEDLYKQMNGRTIFKRLMGIGEIKAYMLSMVACLSPRLLYYLCRRLNLNG